MVDGSVDTTRETASPRGVCAPGLLLSVLSRWRINTVVEHSWSELCREALAADPRPQILQSVKLPALPGVVDAFLQTSADPNASAHQLARTLESDSGITCELLKHVNCASTARHSRIGSVAHALTVLGLSKARTFVTTIGIQAAMASAQTRVMNQVTFWNESLQRALFAREVARAGNIDGELAFLGALLQDFLLPVLASEYPETYFDFLRQAREEGVSLCDYERRVFHCDHATAAAHLAHQWHLPDELVCCIRYHHQIPYLAGHGVLGDTVCLPVAISSLLFGQMRQVHQGEERLMELDRRTGLFDLSTVCESVDAAVQDMAHGNRVQFPLTRRFRHRLSSV